ncbi:DUF2442 domain-containing protein [Tepidicella xavieri]|jgi:hypothetical protein|uniref:Uncharacterized protein DUF2442 n=1 Tax=Tepidicella xavieri TaxID=360241 RepID=A0A4R6UF98_9BURK|nr:DUF2442 domain-containing protein [Tepidicella xavieri]TDQ41784.1 uncharacterized protein DUF2442 [Tepidicella xavieri]
MSKPALPDWVRAELERVPEAAARGLAADRPDLRAVAARYDARRKRVVVELANGTWFAFPPALAQGLAGASAADLAVIEISPMGTGLHWPRLDADLTVEGLLAGAFGSRAWMREWAAKAGRVSSPAKASAARANGAKGGRPRKAVA